MVDDSAVVVDGGDAAPVATTTIETAATETMATGEEVPGMATTVTTTTTMTSEGTASVAATGDDVGTDSTAEGKRARQEEESAGDKAGKGESEKAKVANGPTESAGEPADTEAPAAMEVDEDSKYEPSDEQAQNGEQANASAVQKQVEPTALVEPSAVESEIGAGKRKEIEPPAADVAQDASTAQEAASKKQKTEANEGVKVETPAPVPAPVMPPAAPASQSQSTDKAPDAATTVAPAPIMISRDDMAKMEEDGGLVKFDVITNDGTPEHMVQLTTLKNIFAKQLPKMPKEYIVRLVFDRNHRSMVILKNGTHVIGGICYRPFLPNHFAEIAFCAINAADQVKGYGTRLMNHLKEFVKQEGITHFLTYADNYAIGYFKKQGFAKVVSMPRPNWFGYIKDYDGGTLMECTIHYQIDYLRITSMVHKQRKVRHDVVLVW